MKVLLLNGSSHPNGTTMAAIKEMEKVFHAENVETEVIQVGESRSRIVCSVMSVRKQESVCLKMTV